MHPIHPMLVHFPIALLSASVLFDLLGGKWRAQDFQTASLYTLVLGLAGAVLSLGSGGLAEEAVEHSGVPERALEIHEAMAFAASAMFAGLLGLRVGEWAGVIHPRPTIRAGFGIAAVIVLFIASYFGGNLVYEYGAGVTLPGSGPLR
jgi:uncharacterized membrane protein